MRRLQAAELRRGDTVDLDGHAYRLTDAAADVDGVWIHLAVGDLDLPLRLDHDQPVTVLTPETDTTPGEPP